MNRKMRRSLKITKEQSDILDKLSSGEMLECGSKVKLKYNQIIARKDWDKLSKNYKTFVEENKDVEFTIEETDAKNLFKMVSLREDTTDPKWLFWVGDLILLED